MRAAAARPASHPASRLSVSIPDSHLHCLSFSALIGFLVLTHTPGPVFDPGDGFSRSLGLQLPSLSRAVESGGGRAGVTLMFQALYGWGAPSPERGGAHGRSGWEWGLSGSIMVNGFSLWDFSFPLVRAGVVVVDPYLEDMGSLSPWINRTLIFLHASGCACSNVCLLLAGPPENGPRTTLNVLAPLDPEAEQGRARAMG